MVGGDDLLVGKPVDERELQQGAENHDHTHAHPHVDGLRDVEALGRRLEKLYILVKGLRGFIGEKKVVVNNVLSYPKT